MQVYKKSTDLLWSTVHWCRLESYTQKSKEEGGVAGHQKQLFRSKYYNVVDTIEVSNSVKYLCGNAEEIININRK